MSIILDDDQARALDLMKSGANVFLTGKAGTGKSAVLGEFREWCRDNKTSCVFLAPTGVAAINIGGATIHSFLQLAPTLQSPDTIKTFNTGRSDKARIVEMTRAIVIDEISMVRSDLFAAIDWRLRSLSRGADREKPFGGKQMIVVGDFFQLPPVVSTGDVLALLNRAKPEEKEEFFRRWTKALLDLSDNEIFLFLPTVLGVDSPSPEQIEAIRKAPDLFRSKLEQFLFSAEGPDKIDAFFEDLRRDAPNVNYGYSVSAEYLLDVQCGGTFAFQAKQWNRDGNVNLWHAAGFQPAMLGISHRQADDKTFGAACDAVRADALDTPFSADSDSNPLDWLARRVNAPISDTAMRLCPTNGQVKDINEDQYRKHAGSEMVFKAVMTGSVLRKYERNLAEGKVRESAYPTDVELKLWPGARIMVLKNEKDADGGYIYVNGSLGTVAGFTVQDGKTKVRISLDGSRRLVEIERHKWPSYEYQLQRAGDVERVVAVETGSFEQFPVKLAYAITIHKSQGLSLDEAGIELGRGCFAAGQLYTALTRVRSFSGLRLDRPIEKKDNKLDSAVVEFYRKMEASSTI
ncbi:MAG: AAA family ATPase [Kiritimatiellae bacterium]|nr:AAA family ATPase [Kiritimatiellia bacterium]